jgi:uncharacterized protein (UPF0276 family)
VGIGLRQEFLWDVLDSPLQPEWFEVVPENWFNPPVALAGAFEAVAERYELAAHGLGLSIGSFDPLDRAHLKKLRRFLDRYEIGHYSEHLSFTRLGGKESYELLPLPMTQAMVRHLVDRIDAVQCALKRPLILENATRYATPIMEMSEPDFINAVLKKSGAKLLLDVNNLYVNACNHHFDPYDFVDRLDLRRVAYYHIAGHLQYRSDLLIDTHGEPVAAGVFELFETLYNRVQAPVLLERDNRVPGTLEGLREEYDRLSQITKSAAYEA